MKKLFDKEKRKENLDKFQVGFNNKYEQIKVKSKDVYGKSKVVTKKSFTFLLIRTIFMILVPGFLWVISTMFFIRGLYYASFFSWILLPVSWFLVFGSFRSRIVNLLPLLAVIVYIVYGLEIQDFNQATIIFFFVPFLSLLLKFKKHYIQYITLGISIVYVVVNYLGIYVIPFYAKWGLIVIIYVIFIPPMIGTWLNKIFYGKKHQVSEENN